jgi:hypothetical protein
MLTFLGFTLNGVDQGDHSGTSVSGAGDINGDGLDDLIIGAPEAETNNNLLNYPGESHVVFGSDQGFPANFELSNLNGSNGFTLKGVGESSKSGHSVSDAGDVNGDGFDDLVIGAPYSGSVVGESYVVFGSDQGFPANFELSNLNGSNGFTLNGVDNLNYSGASVSGAGDINSDGLDDLIVGADDAEESYVVFGSDQGFPANFNLSSLNGSNGFTLKGIGETDFFSDISVSGAGDVNGDGTNDLIVGAEGADPYGIKDAGESYVIFGDEEGFPASVDVSTLDGSNGFTLKGIDEDDNSGTSVSSAGDINDDGFDDLIVGADQADQPNDVKDAGESYVIFGSDEGFPASLDLSSLNGNNGFTFDEVDDYDNLGVSVSGAGEINSDGIDDLIVGAENNDDGSYVVYGSAAF